MSVVSFVNINIYEVVKKLYRDTTELPQEWGDERFPWKQKVVSRL